MSQEPTNRYLCEARQPGKPSFEFASPDEDSARAMCDVHGWEYIRCYQPASHADRPANAPEKGNAPLSTLQLKALAIDSSRAYRLQKDLGLVDEAEAIWRHKQVQSVCKRDGLRQCQNSHYPKLLRHFRLLNGSKSIPPLPAGAQSSEGGDTEERRSQLIALIARDLGQHTRRCDESPSITQGKGPITEAYLMTLARAKNAGTTLHDVGCLIKLSAARLEELLFTLRNRCASREGRGKAQKRNKKQRGGDQA